MAARFATLSALFSAVLALQITAPSKDTVWATGESQTIKWDAVSTDQSSFSIYLSNYASYPPTDTLLKEGVSKDDGSLTIDGSSLTAGNAYKIRFTNGTKTEQIYAESNQFNITAGDSTSSTTSAASEASGSSTATVSGATTLVSATASASGSSASETSSTSSGNATSTSSSSSESSSVAESSAGKVVIGAGWMAALGLAALAL